MRSYAVSTRRGTAAAVSLVLVVSFAAVLRPGVAHADAGPSVPLPITPSVPAVAQSMGSTPPDEAGGRELRGDQPAGAAAPDGGGTPKATSLAPSATWSVSAHTGDFTWSYPLRVPPAPGGLEPELALSYSSSAVDGRTSATNNQPSWVGDGWDLHPGFVERTYGGCADDTEGGTTPPQTGDLCWRSDNATAAYHGGGGMLIRDTASGAWRPKNDDGARVDRLNGAGNGDNDGEYWRITTVDGTQYLFGSRPEAASTWTVPVFGDDAGEPCHGSFCTQAWRWNLDKVVDRHGNVMLYTYEAETNSYGRNLQDSAVSYVRGGRLKRVDYGLHENPAAPASGQVEFVVADRCVPGSTCTVDRPQNWPDTPLDQRCATPTCAGKYSPTFWTTKRLSRIVTRVLAGSGFTDVDSWTLDHQFPDPGDGEKAALWLKSITHTGLAGGEITLPPVTFTGAKMPNRVVRVDGAGPLVRFRITGIVSEAGGVTSIDYAEPDCTETALPANPETNTRRCFPVRWRKKDLAERTDYFHKYVVAAVVTSDRIAANPATQVAYEYLDGAAWHRDTSEFTPPDEKLYNEFRGFGRVRTRTGTTDDPGGAPVELSEQRFYRGMHGDPLPGGGTRSVTVTDSEGGVHTDEDWLVGTAFEQASYDGDGGPVVSKTLTEPTWQGPTAVRGGYRAYLVRPGVVRVFTSLAAGGARVTRTESGYDDRGLVTRVNNLGDVATAADDLCTRTTYARNTEAWLLSFPSRVEEVAVHCGATPAFPDHAVSDERSSYDGRDWGQPPAIGNVTRLEVLDQRPASGPVHVLAGTAVYDARGRVVESADPLGNTTRATYTPEVAGPVTRTVATNPLGYLTTTNLAPAFGAALSTVDVNGKTTESTYDALGRLTEVWLPNRPRTDNPSGNARYSYAVRNDAPSVVTTTRIGPTGNYTTSNTLHDGLLRVRQVQAPAAGGGRLITDTRYNTHGRMFKTTQPYYHDAPVDSTLWVASDTAVPSLTVTLYDGAGRATAQIFKGGGTEKWRTSTRYGGDRVHVTPPGGATATTSISDARGRTVELRQYRAATPTGSFDATRYSYTPDGQLATVADPAGNTWQYRHDLRGRQVWTSDPDKGVSTATYDNAGRLLTQTDARGQTLAYEYDALDRRTAVYAGSVAGPRLTGWTYDSVAKGQVATASSYDADGNAYTTAVTAYTALYQPLRTTVTIPATEGLLAGTYTTTTRSNVDGSLASTSYPAIGNLFAESVFHTYNDVALPLRTYGGPTGSTVEYALDTEYTRYGEVQRIHLGEGDRQVWLSSYYDDHTRRLKRSIVDAELPRPMQADVSYGYDPAGNVTSIADTPQDLPADTQCFQYDHLRRLIEAWTPDTGCAAAPAAAALAGPGPYWQSFAYDVVGNRRTETRHAAAGDTTRTYTYPDPGQARPHAVTSIGSRSYSYDAAGNAVTRGSAQLDWDAQGHLAAVTETGRTTRFVYDASGERLIRRDPTATMLYLDGQELRLDRGTGALTGTRYYTHGAATVAVRTGAGLTWLAADHHGTAQVAVSSANLTAEKRRSDPFGNLRGTPPAGWPGEKGFVGGTVDATGLTHLGAREYDPMSGQFISVDPVLDPTDPQQLNAYAYANNNPRTMSDPDGLKYFVDVEGYVTAPPAAAMTAAAMQRVEQRLARYKPMYERWAKQRKAVSRAAQHDWNGANGVKGRVGGYNAAAVPLPPPPEPPRKKCSGFFGCIGHAFSSAVSAVSDFVQENKGWLQVGLGVLSFVPGVGPLAFALGTALAVADAATSCAKGDAGNCAAGIASVGLGFVGAGAARIASNVRQTAGNLAQRAANSGVVRGAVNSVARVAVKGASNVVQGASYVYSGASLGVTTLGAFNMFSAGAPG